jgi:hypothetical protein
MATIAELLYLFRDGQAAKSIGPEAFQTMIVELHLATGLFQDLPSSSAGLAAGRLYLNGGVVQMATGGITASPNGNFLGVATAAFLANVSFTRRAARSTMAASTSLFANAQVFILPIPPALFVGSGATTLSANAQLILKYGNTTASGAGTFSADTALPLRAGFSTMAGAGALAATASFARMSTSATLAGSAALTPTPISRRASNATMAGAAGLSPTPFARMVISSTLSGASALAATPRSYLLATTLSATGAFSSAFSSAFPVSSTTLAGSTALTANPVRASSFSSAFSTAFG